MEIPIFVDSNEPDHVAEKLSTYDLRITRKNLPYADIVSNRTCIERKTWSDLWASVKDSRLMSQAERMSGSYKANYIVVYGEQDYRTRSGYNFMKPLLSAIAKVSARYNVTVLGPISTEDAAFYLIFQLIKKHDDGSGMEPLIIRHKPKKVDQKLLMVLGIRDIGKITAKEILKEYKTVEKLCEASTADLCTIKGIGKVTAKKIWEALH